jgi:hypothetical protein
MAEDYVGKATGAAAQLSKIGFVEFTTDLVKNVYNTIVQASMDQLKAYADLVKDVSKSLSEYLAAAGLTGAGTDNMDSECINNCEKYAVDVLGLKKVVETAGNPSGTPPTTDTYKYEFVGTDVEQAVEKYNAIKDDLKGFDYDKSSSTAGTFEQLITTQPVTSTLTISSTLTKNFLKIISLKLAKHTEDNYKILVTILKLGLQKIIVTKGLIRTKLEFHVDATETSSQATTDIKSKANSFGLSGGASGGIGTFGGKIGGGFSSSKLSVSVVNTRSSGAVNLNIDIVGEVSIEFRTDSFPSVGE